MIAILCNMYDRLLLRELLNTRMDALERQLKAIHTLLDSMSEKVVKHYEFENLKFQVASLAEGIHELEQRVNELEQHNSIIRWVVRQVVTVVIIVIIVWLIGLVR